MSTKSGDGPVNYARMPKPLQERLLRSRPASAPTKSLAVDRVHLGDAQDLMKQIAPESVALSVWSPPYWVGKSYEADLSFDAWQELLRSVIALHFQALRPGGFLVVNIADILCFRDESMPKVQAQNIRRHRSRVTREDVLAAMVKHPEKNRYQLAALLGCSEQTIDRRLNGNNIRGGKYDAQTRVKVVGGLVEQWALAAGLYPYDRRIWVKDAAWENSRWSSLSYRSVDEFEYLYIFWKPGVTVVDRARLTPHEWKEWGYRAVWFIPSVRANDDHEAKFPVELPQRVIRLFTGPDEVVLDCFMGSGTTAVAALLEKRHFLGIEKESRYVTLAQQRIVEVAPNVHRSSMPGGRFRPGRKHRKSFSPPGQPRLI
jgi:site-specific DNA-methyltransferase (adenine-specific)